LLTKQSLLIGGVNASVDGRGAVADYYAERHPSVLF